MKFHDVPPGTEFRRWMGFVDGENFTLRAQEFALKQGVTLVPGAYYLEDNFLWLPGMRASRMFPDPARYRVQGNSVRSYYYTSVQGDDTKLGFVKQRLWDLGFTPRVFKKPPSTRTKGVDITLTLDMVSHAFENHYDVAALVAGDADYVPLVEQVKRLGKAVVVLFFENIKGLSPDLKLAADEFISIDAWFKNFWEVARKSTDQASAGATCRMGARCDTAQQKCEAPGRF